MPVQDLQVPSLLGGISRVSQNGRAPNEIESGINIEMYPDRGVDKRPGTAFVGSPDAGSAQGEITVENPLATPFTLWVNRGEGERFLIVLDPTSSVGLQAFNAETGAEIVVHGPTGLPLSHIDNAELLAYLTAGTAQARRRFSSVVIEDRIVILNREVDTALTGGPITYKNGGTPAEVRNQNNSQNVESWSDFSHPPVVGAGSGLVIPVGLLTDPNADVTDVGLWFARNDDVGLPSGFWLAVSATQPPWFIRVRTESAGSVVDPRTMPHALDWDGTKFTFKEITYPSRLSGDSFTNPGPSFIGSPLTDVSFTQDRLWMSSGENIVSSQLGDLFNVWIDSVILQVDTDPIDRNIAGDRFSPIINLVSFREAVVCMTAGGRQVELRANGPLTPSTVMMFDSTNITTVNFVRPAVMGSQMYFLGERDFSHTVWEYAYSPSEVSNTATEITSRVRGLIPGQASLIAAASQQTQLFLLTDAQPTFIYVNRAEFQDRDRGRVKVMNAWYIWDMGGEVLSLGVMDEALHLLMRRDGLLWIETTPLGFPDQDADGSPAQTLGYAVRLDRKIKVQGVYDPVPDETTWTLPWEESAEVELVLAATWDTADQKMGGFRIQNATKMVGGGVTTLSLSGNWEDNADGANAPAYVGVPYTTSVDLSELFFRTPEGAPIHGTLTLKKGKIRFRDAATFSIIIDTPGRAARTREYTVPSVGSTPLDGVQLEQFGEFQFPIFAKSRKLLLRLLNDTPYPASWIDLDIRGHFIPQAHSTLR